MFCSNCQLDAQQIESIVACEDAQLVLASAGSGKTLSLLGKVEYLNRELKIPAEQILAISFTQKTVMELKERCGVKDVEIRTFHGLGNNILQFATHPALGNKSLIDDVAVANFIRKYCEYLIRNDCNFARDFIDFVLFFNSTPASPSRAKNHAQRISFNRLYLRHVLDSASNLRIRSKDEQLIANWFYLYGIEFAHDEQYPQTDIKYRVSFTLKYPRRIYIDYVIIDQKRHSFYGPNYLRDIKWRQEMHSKNQTQYIVLPS